MSTTFEQIKEQIAKDLESKKSDEVVAVAGKKVPEVDEKGMPSIAQSGVIGTIVSKPGTESVLLDASTFQFMECKTSAVGRDRKRYCIVEKDTYARYGNQYINAAGFRTHIVTRELFELLYGVVRNINKQLVSERQELARTKEQRDMYKLTIDALRKNGIID